MSGFYLRQATASQTRLIGPFVDDTDFKTAETGLTIANTDIKLSINGGSSANKNSGGGTHIVNGEYAITLDATDTATVGELTASVSVAGALLVKKTFWVLEEAIYDALFGASATGLLPANVTQISGDSGAADNLEAAYDGTGYDVGGIDVSELNQIVDDLLNGGRLDLLVDAIKAKTDQFAFTTGGKVDARVDYVGTNAVTTPDDFKATSVTVSDKTGFSLAASQAFDLTGNITGNLSGSVGSVTGNVEGNVSGSVGSISDVTFPANFAALGINVSGHVSRVTLVDTTTDNTDMRGTDGANTTTPPSVSAIRSEIDSNSTQLAAILEDTGTTLPAQITTAQNDLDILTGTDGVTLATSQPNYAPAKAGDQMDLVDAPNATAVTAIQNGLTLATKLLNYVRLLARKDSAVATDLATELGEINADTGTGTGTFGNNDALESIRDNASGLDAAGMRDAIGMASANMDTQLGNIQTGVNGISTSASPTLLQTATIATLDSQTSFTLSAGSTDNDAYNNAIAIIVDQSTSTQKTVVNISDYIGSTRTVTLSESPKFTVATGDTVYVVATSKTTLTDDVVNSLTGTLVRFNGPAWTGNGWDRPFIKGDSYLGGNKVNITVENWSGDQLIAAASAIKLSGTRTVSGTTTTFSWSVTPGDVTVSGTTTTIPLELTASDTDIEAGEYTADLRATWASPAEVTSLIQPTFKLSIVAPVSTFD